MGKRLEDKREFYKAGIVFGAASLILGFLAVPIESIVLAVVALILSILKRNTYRIKVGVILAVLGLLESVPFLVFLIYLGVTKQGALDYWFFELLFHPAAW